MADNISTLLNLAGSVDIDRGAQLYSDLCNAREALCVVNYLHLLYLVTPYDMVKQVKPNWMTYLDEVRMRRDIACFACFI